MSSNKKYHKNHTELGGTYQRVLPLSLEGVIPEDDSVRLLSHELEELDYTTLHKAYSSKGRNPAVEPKTMPFSWEIRKMVLIWFLYQKFARLFINVWNHRITVIIVSSRNCFQTMNFIQYSKAHFQKLTNKQANFRTPFG